MPGLHAGSMEEIMNKLFAVVVASLFVGVVSTPATAGELAITRVTDHVYSAIGETLPPSYENRGHNNNLSFIIAS